MTRTSKELLALALGLGLGLAACNKSNPPGVASVEFVSPLDGGVLTADAGTVSNVQLSFEVTANVSNAPIGSTLHLKANGIATGDPVNAPASGSGEVTLSATLAGADPATPYVLEIDLDSSTSPGGPPLASASIDIGILLTTSTGACQITIAPPDGSLFNETGNPLQGHNTVKDEDLTTAGMQANLTVTVGPPCPDGVVTLMFGDGGGDQPAPVTSQSGVATFTGITLPETTAAALLDATKLLAVTASAGAGSEASSDTILYIVDSSSPACTITSPTNSATITMADDLDSNTPGIQINVSGTCQGFIGGEGISIIDPTTSNSYGTSTIKPGDPFSVEVTVPVGTDELELSGSSFTGNPATSNTVTVMVNNSCPAPTLTFKAPTMNQSFNLADDQGVAPGLQTVLRLTSTNVPNSDSIEICSTVPPTADAGTCGFGTGLFEVGTTMPSSGNATLTATVGDDGATSQTLTAQFMDLCGSAQAMVAIEVHSIQPVIDSIVLSNDFIDSDGGIWLNASALQAGGAATTVTLTVDGADMFGDGGAVVSLGGNLVTGAFTGTSSPSAQVQLANLADGTYTFDATATDIWGNTSNPSQAIPVAVKFPLHVKTSLPTCTIAARTDPTTGCFNIGDNGGTAANGAVGVPILVTAANASGLDANGLTIDGTASVTLGSGAPISDPIASFVSVSVSSAQGANVYSATVTDPAGNEPVTCTPTSLNVDVSTEPPTFTATPGATASGMDANGCEIYLTRDGIPFTVTTTDIANGSVVSLVVTGANGGSSPKTSGTVTANSTSITVNGVPNGVDSITVTGTDACGNPGTGNPAAAKPCIDVQAAGCDLSLVTPTATETDAGESVVFNASQVTDAGTTSIELHTSCTGTQVQFDSTASGGSDQPQDGGVDANGNVTFDLSSLIDGSSGTFTADISGGDSLPSISYEAKLSLPAYTTATPVAGSLEVVANQDNLILSDAGVTILAVDGGTIVANEAQCPAANACADFTISGISGLGPADGNGNIGTASLALNFGGGTTNPNPITIASYQTPVTFTAVMPAVGSGTVTLTLADNVGNTTTETWDVTTNGIQPPAPALAAAMSDKRMASVKLSWTVPATTDSATQGYELAYVINNLNASAPGIPSEATYTSWTLDPGIAGVNGAVGANLTYTKKNLPTLNQYSFELRAIDAVGNRSPLAASATAISVSPTDSNAWQTVVITDTANDAADSDFGYVLRNGDFNKDGMQDLVITAPYQYAANATPGIVYIVSGAADPSKYTFAGLTSITLGGTAFDWFGQDAHVADYNGDGVDDLAVGSPEWNDGQGRVDIFFGQKNVGLPAAPSTTIVGDSTQSGLFGYSVSAVDVDGDGIPDLLVGAPAMGASGNGASYLFLAKNGWPKPNAGADVTSATSVITGNAGDGLGARWGSVAIGDINGDGDGDFTVSAPGGGGTDGFDAGTGSLYGFSGKTALANATMTVAANALFTLSSNHNPPFCDPMGFGYASGDGDEAFTFWGCFGVNAIGDVSFTGGALPDLIVSSDYYSTVDLFTMSTNGPNVPATMELSDQAGALGWSMVAPDLNGDGRPDLLVGENFLGTPNVLLYLNIDGGFPPPARPIAGNSSGQSGELFGTNAFGYGLAAGDFQGISKPDFAVSDWDSADVTVYY